MAYHQAMGANHAEGYPHIGPGDWTDVGTVDELPEGEPDAADRRRRRRARRAPRRARIHALADRCAHASAPLHEGRHHERRRPPTCVVCPWHGSVFRLDTGSVVHGPATAPQPTFRTRVRDGRLELAVTGYAGRPGELTERAYRTGASGRATSGHRTNPARRSRVRRTPAARGPPVPVSG